MNIPAQHIAKNFQSNHWVSLRLLEGITHPESLLTPQQNINSINWILGHIINGRNEALKYLDKPGMWGETISQLYRSGSDPVPEDVARPLTQLLADFDESQADLEFALAEAPQDYLAETITTNFGDRPRGVHVASLAWHETYHIGQFELLRAIVLAQRETQFA